MTEKQTPPRWDLTTFFPSLDSDEFREAFAGVVSGIAGLAVLFDRHDVRRRPSPGVDAALAAAFEEATGELNALLEKLRTLGAYISCIVTTDARDEAAQAAQQRKRRNEQCGCGHGTFPQLRSPEREHHRQRQRDEHQRNQAERDEKQRDEADDVDEEAENGERDGKGDGEDPTPAPRVPPVRDTRQRRSRLGHRENSRAAGDDVKPTGRSRSRIGTTKASGEG